MEPIIVAILAGVVVYILFIALIPKSILGQTTRYTRSALEQLERESSSMRGPEETVSIMRDQINQSNAIVRALLTLPGARALYPRLVKAGLHESIDKFFLVLIAVLVGLIYALRGLGPWSVAAALVLTYLFGWKIISGRIRKRTDTFLNGFPDALDMIVRSVKSGYPLNAAIRMVAENTQAPICDEFKQVADETTYGTSLVESLQRLSVRINEPDIRFFVVVLAVQQEVGGNLAEVLSNLAAIIRKRRHLRMKIKAMTSEGRATSWVLGSLPVFVFVLIYITSPGHLLPFFVTSTGHMLLATAIGIILTGALIVNRMVNIEV